MPMKPRKPCQSPLCGELIHSSDRFCTKHKSLDHRRRNKARVKTTIAGYDKSWRKIRNSKLKINPLCERCEKEGIVKEAECVHHIMEVKDGGGNEISNLMSLCNNCHNKEHKRFGNK